MRHHAAFPLLVLALPLGAVGLELGEAERAGKRIYLEGVGPGGREITASLGGDATVLPAAAVPCAGCHGDDGVGRPEGGVAPSPVTWSQLTKPYGHLHPSGRGHRAYDEAAVARAVVGGHDPEGQPLEPAMPRYSLTPEEVAALTAYLKVLERDLDPGVEPEALRLAVALPTTGRWSEVGAAMRGVLEAYLGEVNAAGGVHGRRLELAIAGFDGDRGDAVASLRRTFDERPTFALVSGFFGGAGEEVAAFARQRRVPLVGPFMLEAAGGEGAAPCVFQVLSGLREQARVLAVYAARELDAGARALVLHPGDPVLGEAAQLAREQLAARGWRSVELQRYDSGRIDARATSRARRARPEVVLLLGGDADLAAFTREADALGWAPRLLALGMLAPRAATVAPARFQGRIFLAYPVVPSDEKPASVAELARLAASAGVMGRNHAAQVSAYTAAVLAVAALRRAGRALSRERLVASLEALHEFDAGLVPPITFGPGRRVGALGGYVVAVDLGTRSFRPVGEWIPLE